MGVVSVAEYVQGATVVYVTQICQVVSATVVLYDHALTLDREVSYVWNRPFSFGSISYLLMRYIGDALSIWNIIAPLGWVGPTQQVCEVYFFVQSWLFIFVLFMIQLMLQVRLYALYQQSKIILALMITCYVCEIAAISTLLGLVDADARITNEILTGLYVCADLQAPSFYQLYMFWLPVIVYDGMLCLLALRHGITKWLSGYRANRVDGVDVADALVKGNVSYFLCLLVACIANVSFKQVLGLQWQDVSVSEAYPTAMEVVVGCRLILNLRLSLVQDLEVEDPSYDLPRLAVTPPSTTLSA